MVESRLKFLRSRLRTLPVRPACGQETGREGGFTLIEIMVSLALIGLLLPAVLFAFSNSAQNRSKADNRILAANLLRDKISEMEAIGLPDVGTEDGEFQEGSRFRWQTDVSETETEGLLDVVVRILWTEAGIPKEFAIHMQMADKALAQTGGAAQQP